MVIVTLMGPCDCQTNGPLQFSVPRIEFAFENKVVMYTSCASTCHGAAIVMSVCAIVIVTSDTMVACIATFLWNNSTICHHKTGSVHIYWPPSGYSIWGTQNCHMDGPWWLSHRWALMIVTQMDPGDCYTDGPWWLSHWWALVIVTLMCPGGCNTDGPWSLLH